LHRTLPEGRPIGESWDVVDRAEAQSRVQDGPWAGLTLRDLLQAHSAQIMGSSYPPERPFPILVKWLDCRERLSLQVHPPAEIAPALRGEPKTENWYIAEAEPGASLIVGLKHGTSRADFAKALVNTALEPCLHRFPVSAGDSILVRSGTVHAIDAGNLILEIQQNSDTTYRVYDWGRVWAGWKAQANACSRVSCVYRLDGIRTSTSPGGRDRGGHRAGARVHHPEGALAGI
jgi:mannose-6-phosphate isomerase